MTKAEFRIEGESLIMETRGHAGFEEIGKDPVCAGASVLAISVAQCIALMGEEGKLRKKPHIIVRNGRVSVAAKPLPEHFGEALHTFYVGEIGFRLLAESYPANVEVRPFVTPDEG